MSHRGNLITVNENGYIVRRCHNSILHNQLIFWGSNFILDYFQHYEPSDYWNPIVDDESSILIDQPNKTVIFYGSGYIQLHVPRFRLFLKLMQHVWAGWNIKWADRGLFDIADYVKYPRSNIDYRNYSQYISSEGFLIDSLNPDETWHDGIISVNFSDGQIRLQQASSFFDILTLDKKLIEHVWNNGSLSPIEWYSTEADLPRCGIHIDQPAKRLYFWSAYPLGNWDFLEKWQDWETVWLENDFDKHVKLTGNLIKLDIPSEDELLASLRTYLLVETTHAEHTAKYGHFSSVPIISDSIEIPHYATHLVDRLPPIEERTRIFETSVAQWRSQ